MKSLRLNIIYSHGFKPSLIWEKIQFSCISLTPICNNSIKSKKQGWFANLIKTAFSKTSHDSKAALLSLIPLFLLIATIIFRAENSVSSLLSTTTNTKILAQSFDTNGTISIVHIAWLGLVTGCLHTLAGPDHLAALTPLAIGKNRFLASILGALWGLGHSVGQMILVFVFAMLKDKFDCILPALNKYGGILIGLTLVSIGLIGLRENMLNTNDIHDLNSDSKQNANLQKISFGFNGKLISFNQGIGTLFTGIIYGLNPDTLFMLIPALALPSKIASLAYILMFINGTILAMSGYTFAISATSEVIGKNVISSSKYLSIGASIIATLFGGLIILSGI